MRRINPFFLLSLLGTILLAVNILLLPRYISRTIDTRNMNTVTAANRDDFSFLETGSGSVQDTVYALDHMKRDGSNLKLITSFDQSARINDELLKNVYDQVMNAAELGMLPGLGSREYDITIKLGLEAALYEYWVHYIKSAKYYSLTYDSPKHANTQEIMNFWFLHFSDSESFDYYFLVDAATYRIYYAEIYNPYTETLVSTANVLYNTSARITEEEKSAVLAADKMILDALSINEFWFPDGCMLYYEANSYRSVSADNLTDKLALVVLGYENESLYIEQIVLPADKLTYDGISIGFQGMSEKIQSLIKE